jgi:hypothetical protein
VRVLGWTRTSDLQVRNLALSPLSYEDVSYENVRALGAIRTRTNDVLNAVPLPLDHEGGWRPNPGATLQAEDSNPQCPVQSRMCCRVTPACKGPGGVMARPGRKNGAATGIRTRDLRHGKATL